MMKANEALAEWNPAKKRWEVHIHAGAEVVKRPLEELNQDSGDDAIRRKAVETAHDEGYEIDPASVQIQHDTSATVSK